MSYPRNYPRCTQSLYAMTPRQLSEAARMARIAGREDLEMRYLEQIELLRRIGERFTAQRDVK
jgi:division protein CdvB (Snf7/Vps24/ESCRT-III family)